MVLTPSQAKRNRERKRKENGHKAVFGKKIFPDYVVEDILEKYYYSDK